MPLLAGGRKLAGDMSSSEAQKMGWDDPSHTGEGSWAMCTECGDPTDGPDGGPHTLCGQFLCPGECGAVVAVPRLACPGCVAWVASEDDAARLERLEIEFEERKVS